MFLLESLRKQCNHPAQGLTREESAGECEPALSPEELNRLPRAGWIVIVLLEWLRKQCNHPAQGLAELSPQTRLISWNLGFCSEVLSKC